MKRLLPLFFGLLIIGGLFVGCSNSNEETNVSGADTVAHMPTVIVCSLDSEGEVNESSFEIYEYNGKQYVFSSEACREIITSDPEEYLGDEEN